MLTGKPQHHRRSTNRLAGLLAAAFFFMLLLMLVWNSRRPPRVLPSAKDPAVVLLAMGDFGVDPDDAAFAVEFRASNAVFRALNGEAARYAEAGFAPKLLLAGDLVYPHGIPPPSSSSSSSPRFMNTSRLEGVFHRLAREGGSHVALMHKYAVPGNHDCEGDLSSAWPMVIDKVPTWKRPSKRGSALYGETVFPAPWGGGGGRVRVLSLETCSLVCGGGGDGGGGAVNFRCRGDNMAKYAYEPEFAQLRQEQLEWLKNQVEPKRPGDWLVVMGHFPVYSFRGNGPTRELWPLLQWMRAMRVDAYISGHDHALQSVTRSNDNNNSPLFLITGAGGYTLHPEIKPDADAEANAGAELVHVQDAPGFMTLEFRETELKVLFVNQYGQVTSSHASQRR